MASSPSSCPTPRRRPPHRHPGLNRNLSLPGSPYQPLPRPRFEYAWILGYTYGCSCRNPDHPLFPIDQGLSVPSIQDSCFTVPLGLLGVPLAVQTDSGPVRQCLSLTAPTGFRATLAAVPAQGCHHGLTFPHVPTAGGFSAFVAKSEWWRYALGESGPVKAPILGGCHAVISGPSGHFGYLWHSHLTLISAVEWPG